MVSVNPARRGFPLTAVMRPTSVASKADMKPGNRKRNKPWPTGPHWTNRTHRYRAQNAAARAQQHGSDLWSPVRDEEAAGSNPVTPTVFPQVIPVGAGPCQDLGDLKFGLSSVAARTSR